MKVEAKTHQQVWIERFEGTLQNPFSHTRQWVETGVSKGLVPDNDQARLNFAREMAGVMSFVLPENQTERLLEDLDLKSMAVCLKADSQRVADVANLMADVGAIISRKKREVARLKNGGKLY